MRLAHTATDRATYNQIVEARKKEMIDYNMKTFGNVAIGIHGKELPKFAQTQNVKEYWKLGNNYKDKPAMISALELHRTHKYWAKPEELLLTDVRQEAMAKDPLKITHVPKQAKTAIAEKVNGINHFKNEGVDYMSATGSAAMMHSRWTEVVHYFEKKSSAYEEDPNMRQSLLRYEQLPLPSSFSPNGVFQDPLNKLRAT